MKKAVLKLGIHDDKGKQKVMKAVSHIRGVDSIAIDMKDKKLTVTGDIDAVTITKELRKLCFTEILTVGPAKEEKKKEEEKKEDWKQAYLYPPPYYHARVVEDDPFRCVIL